MDKNIIIANLKARWGLNRSRIRRAEAFFSKNKFTFSTFITDYPGHAREIAVSAANQKVDTIIVLGGDGTLNEVINGVLASGCCRIPRIAIIPSGSSNDFSKSLGMPQQLNKACRKIINGKTRYVDIGLVGNHYFCMASSVGLFAEVSAKSVHMKGLNGSLRYIAAALCVIGKMSSGWEMNIKADERIFHGTYGVLLVSNTSRFGGLFFTPKAKPDDGLFDCLLIEMPRKLEALGLIPLTLRKELAKYKKVTSFQAKSLSVSLNPPAPIGNDGEVCPNLFNSVEYKILSNKMQIIC